MASWLKDCAPTVKVGDVVQRKHARGDFMKLRVTEVTDDMVVCGLWDFDRLTGAEIDDQLGWGPKHGKSGTFLSGIVDEDPDFDMREDGEYGPVK